MKIFGKRIGRQKLYTKQEFPKFQPTTPVPTRTKAVAVDPIRQRGRFYYEGLVSIFREKNIPIVLSPDHVRINPRFISIGVRLRNPTLISQVNDKNFLDALAHGAGLTHVMLDHRDGLLWYQFPIPDAPSPDWNDEGITAETIGMSALGEPVLLTRDEWDRGHILVSGLTGSGKSCLLDTMMYSLTLQYPPDKLGLIVIDPSNVHYYWDRSKYVLGPVASSRFDMASALHFAASEARRRITTREHVTKHDTLQKWVVVIDEADGWEAFPEDSKEVLRYGQILANDGRMAQVHMILGTHRPTSGVWKTVFNVASTKILGQAFDARTSGGYGAGLHLDWLQGMGDFIWKRGDKHVRFQSTYTTPTRLKRMERAEIAPRPFPAPAEIMNAGLDGGVPIHQYNQVKAALDAINPRVVTLTLMNGSKNTTPKKLALELSIPETVATVNYRLAVQLEKERVKLINEGRIG